MGQLHHAVWRDCATTMDVGIDQGSLVEGPLAVHVVYPPENAPMASRDSNYMLGSVGNGRATLTINGHPATVYPNGAFMAFIPNPPASAPRFDLVASLGP